MTLSEILEHARVQLTSADCHKIEGFLTVRGEQLPFQGLPSDHVSGWNVKFASEVDEWIEEHETDAHDAEDLGAALTEIVYGSLEDSDCGEPGTHIH